MSSAARRIGACEWTRQHIMLQQRVDSELLTLMIGVSGADKSSIATTVANVFRTRHECTTGLRMGQTEKGRNRGVHAAVCAMLRAH